MEYTKTCPVCGREFECNYVSRIYCSNRCKNSSRRKTLNNELKMKKAKEIDYGKFGRTLTELKEKGVSYADAQKADTIEKYARIRLDDY